MSRKAFHTLTFNYGTLVLAAVIPFSAKLSTWCIIVLALNWIIEGSLKRKIGTAYRNKFMIACSLFYLLEIAGLFYTYHFNKGFYHAQKEASFLVVPLIYLSYGALSKKLRDKALSVFYLAVFLTSLYCICSGIYNYIHTGDISFLFYHALVAPVHQHAVYFSIYTFICIVYLFDLLKKPLPTKKIVFILLLLSYFSVLLFLLRSKMVIGIAFLYAVYQLVHAITPNRRLLNRKTIFSASLALGIIASLNTSNPLSNQADQLRNTDLGVLSKSQFTQGDHFNEVELRLTLWKFTIEILNERDAWLFGVSPGDAQNLINQKIIEYNMYQGIPGTDNKGFLNYNLHDQYLETLLRSGIAGLFLLLWILWLVFKTALYKKDEVLMVVLFVFAAVFLTESVLEREFGIVPFFFFTCLLIATKKNEQRAFIKKKEHAEKVENIC